MSDPLLLTLLSRASVHRGRNGFMGRKRVSAFWKVLFLFETRSHCVNLAALELATTLGSLRATDTRNYGLKV